MAEKNFEQIAAIFEKASRENTTFFVPGKGTVSHSDLWHLPLTSKKGPSLDAVAVALDAQLREIPKKSFVNNGSAANTQLQFEFDLVKHIIDTRLAENKAKSERAENAEKRAKLREILAERKDKALLEASDEDLKKMLDELGPDEC